MIREFEFYHGVVFSRMLHAASGQKEISIKPFPTSDNASYVVNGKVGIYIKYSAKRLSPWRFTFKKQHQDEILEMKKQIGEVFLLLVCHDDGIAAINFDELKQILNEGHGLFEWVSVARNRREMYLIKGSDGRLEFKVSQKGFSERIIKII